MDKTEAAMRILAVLALSKPGGEIKVLRESADKIDASYSLDCFQDGPLIVVKVKKNGEYIDRDFSTPCDGRNQRT